MSIRDEEVKRNELLTKQMVEDTRRKIEAELTEERHKREEIIRTNEQNQVIAIQRATLDLKTKFV